MMRRLSASSSSFEIAFTGAVFACVSCITCKLLSAVLANESAVCFFVDRIAVAVPPGHTAFVRAEEFRLSAGRLIYGFVAVFTAMVIVFNGMTAHIGTHRIQRNLERFGDF